MKQHKAAFLGLAKPRLRFSDTGEPEDKTTNDVYFSAEGGAEETKTVFLEACDLPTRWQSGKPHVICELGFGTGLNFLVTLAKWQQSALADQSLHYISIEAAPMSKSDMLKAHKNFAAYKKESKELLSRFPPPVKGFHHLHFDSGVSLTLLFGLAKEVMPQLSAKVDSWFLDGFAPAKNPEMWNEKVFTQIARLSAPMAQIGTYTAAGSVRRGLEKVGFNINKKPGYGRKRHRLTAQLVNSVNYKPAATRPARVMIIGGGIAGACLAFALNRAKLPHCLIEKTSLASAASGNSHGLVSPRLDLDDTPLARFYRTAFTYACSFYQQNCPHLFKKTGLLRLATDKKQEEKFTALVQAEALPAEMMQTGKNDRELWLPTAGILQPKRAVCSLTESTTIISAHVEQLLFKNGQWIALDAAGKEIDRAPAVVMATGCDQINVPGLPKLKILRGQVSTAKNIQELPATPILGQSYMVPIAPDTVLFGATHDRVQNMTSSEPCQSDNARNLKNLAQLVPELAAKIDISAIDGRASFRAASPDMQPLAGPVPTAEIGNWAQKHWGKLDDYANAPMQQGLFMLNGLGSRGLTLAPILAEEIISLICGTPSLLEKQAANALHPARFAARSARKNNS